MNEEEKEAIKVLNNFNPTDCGIEDTQAIETILNLIEKQQKEIEELKDKNKTLEVLLQGNLFEMYNYYKELANRYQANCISKDKIKEKIKELESHIWKDGYMSKFDRYAIHYLNELLGE